VAEMAASGKKGKYADIDGLCIFEPIAVETVSRRSPLLAFSFLKPGWPEIPAFF